VLKLASKKTEVASLSKRTLEKISEWQVSEKMYYEYNNDYLKVVALSLSQPNCILKCFSSVRAISENEQWDLLVFILIITWWCLKR